MPGKGIGKNKLEKKQSCPMQKLGNASIINNNHFQIRKNKSTFIPMQEYDSKLAIQRYRQQSSQNKSTNYKFSGKKGLNNGFVWSPDTKLGINIKPFGGAPHKNVRFAQDPQQICFQIQEPKSLSKSKRGAYGEGLQVQGF